MLAVGVLASICLVPWKLIAIARVFLFRNKEICSLLFLEGSVLHAFFFFPNPATDLFHAAVTCVRSVLPRIEKQRRGLGLRRAPPLRAPPTSPGSLEERRHLASAEALMVTLALWEHTWLHLISKTSHSPQLEHESHSHPSHGRR